jgi:plasmid stabilization system protein ParE
MRDTSTAWQFAWGLIVYQVRERHILIVRVLHQSMDIEGRL